jgi:hypothetical protein
MYIVIARTLRTNDPVGGRTVAIALVILQVLVGTNHAAAAIQSHAPLNAIMAAVNYGCVVLGILALRLRRRPGSHQRGLASGCSCSGTASPTRTVVVSGGKGGGLA